MSAAWVFAVVGLGVAIAGAIGTAIVRYVAPVPIAGAFGFNEATQVGYVLGGLTWASVGALLVLRRPENPVGWLMVLIGVGYSVSQATVALTFAFAADGTIDGERLARYAGWITVLLQLVVIFQLAIGFLFPTGRPQSQGWARFMRFFLAGTGTFVVFSLFQSGPLQLIPLVDNPFGFLPDIREGQPIAPFLTAFAMVIIAGLVVSMVTRYRSADRVERQQLEWFVLALSVSMIGLVVAQVGPAVLDRPATVTGLTVFVFGGAIVPVAIGIAILRYHLYAIDRILSRTIAYGVVIGALAVLFYAIVIGLSSALVSFAQGESIAVAASTLVVFAAFQPVARRVHGWVDRRFNRAHYDAQQMAVAFSIRLRDEVDLAIVAGDLDATVRQAVDPTTSGLWIRAKGRSSP